MKNDRIQQNNISLLERALTMKKITSLFVAIILIFSLAACGDENSKANDLNNPGKGIGQESEPEDTGAAPVSGETAESTEVTEPLIESPEGREETIYSDYLVGGQLDAILEGTVIKAKNVRTYAYLEDINGDGIRELLLTATDTFSVATYLFTISQGRIVCLAEEIGMASGAGSTLTLLEDSATGKHVAATMINKYKSQTNVLYERTVKVYDFDGAQLRTKVTVSKYSVSTDGSADSYINKVKAETEYYTVTANDLHWWQADGKYISSSEYNTLNNNYTDYEKKSASGGYSDPLGLKE